MESLKRDLNYFWKIEEDPQHVMLHITVVSLEKMLIFEVSSIIARRICFLSLYHLTAVKRLADGV